jgi:hypothetical protein
MYQKLVVGGRCGVIVPDGVLFGSSNAHKKLRELLLENTDLKAVISLPSGVFKPYAGVSTAVLIFTKGDETNKVRFYDVSADGYSLDDKRNPIDANDIPDVTSTIKSPILNQPVENESKESLITQAPPFVLPHEVPESSPTETKSPEEIKAQIDKIFADDSTSSDNFSSASSLPSNGKSGTKNFFILSVIIFFLVAGGWIYFLYFYQQSTSNTNVSTVSPTPTEIVSEETCELNGTTYKIGESFKSADGCNTCSCQTGNTIACTEMACDISPTTIPATKSASTKKITLTPTKKVASVTPTKTTVTPTKTATSSTKKIPTVTPILDSSEE